MNSVVVVVALRHNYIIINYNNNNMKKFYYSPQEFAVVVGFFFNAKKLSCVLGHCQGIIKAVLCLKLKKIFRKQLLKEGVMKTAVDRNVVNKKKQYKQSNLTLYRRDLCLHFL